MAYDFSPNAPGGTYFFTQRLQDPRAQTLVTYVDILRQAVRTTRKRYPFEIRAAVILPATLHMIWELPVGDQNHALRWRLIKSTFSRHVPPQDVAAQTPVMQRRREKGIWHRRAWDHQIRDQADYDLHEHLIIHAPVTAGLVSAPRDWSLSSIHQRGVGRNARRVKTPSVQAKPIPAEATHF